MNQIIHGYRPAITLSRLAMAGLALIGFVDLLTAVIGVGQIISPGKSLNLIGSGASSLWVIIQGLLALIRLPVYIFTVVVFLMWLYRAYVNLPALRSESTEFTPGWAVGWWFIPFANLVKPFQAVRAVWAESDPEFDPEMGFLSSVTAGAPGFMSLWWAFWIISNITAYFTGQIFDPQRPETIGLSGYLYLIFGITRALAAALAVKIVMDTTARQEQRFRNLGLLQMHAPPPPPTFVPVQSLPDSSEMGQ